VDSTHWLYLICAEAGVIVEEEYLFKKPKNNDREDDSERDEYFLIEPQDFSEYSQLIRNGSATERHHKEFYLRMIQHFTDSVYTGKPPDAWVMSALADAFEKVLHGGRWEDEFPLPWTKVRLPHSRAEWSALGIYCDIENAMKANPEQNVTDAINNAANDHAVSYEKARAAYYVNKKRFSKIPPKT
jgi:hypothetical protein